MGCKWHNTMAVEVCVCVRTRACVCVCKRETKHLKMVEERDAL